MKPSNNLENKTLSDTCWIVQLVCKKAQFFGTTSTGIQSELDAFNKSRLVTSIPTILIVMEILRCFRLVQDGKTGKVIPESSRLEFLEKFSANNFALSDVEDSISRPLNRGCITNLPLLKTLLAICQKSREPCFWEVMDFFYYHMQVWHMVITWHTITSLSERYIRVRRFILLVQTKKVISMNYSSSTSRWGEWGLTWYLRWGIYTSIPTWSHSQNSLATAEALSLKISYHGTSLKWSRRPSQ